jgi:hypothetical protein
MPKHVRQKHYLTNKKFKERITCVKEYFRDMKFLARLSTGHSVYRLTNVIFQNIQIFRMFLNFKLSEITYKISLNT